MVARKPAPEFFLVGDAVLADGIYRAVHNAHRNSHEVTLLAGETFPPCVKCHHDVRFQLLREAIYATDESDFRIRLYELPHPPDEAEEKKTA